jgi:hypothetical protein
VFQTDYKKELSPILQPKMKNARLRSLEFEIMSGKGALSSLHETAMCLPPVLAGQNSQHGQSEATSSSLTSLGRAKNLGPLENSKSASSFCNSRKVLNEPKERKKKGGHKN